VGPSCGEACRCRSTAAWERHCPAMPVVNALEDGNGIERTTQECCEGVKRCAVWSRVVISPSYLSTSSHSPFSHSHPIPSSNMSWKLGSSKSASPLSRYPDPPSPSPQRQRISEIMLSSRDPLPRYRPHGQLLPGLLVPQNNMPTSAPACSPFASSPVRPLHITIRIRAHRRHRPRSLSGAWHAGPRSHPKSARLIASTKTTRQQP